jgi:hypothetical protein
MGGLLLGGLMLKTVGWRAIAFSIGVNSGIYMHERMTWTNNVKCKEFKQQYVVHAVQKQFAEIILTTSHSFCTA